MKSFLIFILLIASFITKAQVDSTAKKNNFFKTSGKVIKNSIFSLPNDFVFMGKEVSDDWGRSGKYALGAVGLILTDKITTKFLHQHIETTINYTLPNISFSRNKSIPWLSGNDAYMTYPVVGLYLGSLITNNEKGQYVAINALKSLSHSIIISQLALKTIFGRKRPLRPFNPADQNIGSWTKDNLDFFNSRGRFLASDEEASSFPSLHATAYFAIAKVFQMEYDNYWIPYGVMSVVFLSDLKGHNHWVGDMVVGGVIGTIIGRSIVKNSWKVRYGSTDRIKREKNIAITVLPSFSPQLKGSPLSLYLAINFNKK